MNLSNHFSRQLNNSGIPAPLLQKWESLLDDLKNFDSAAIAYSGGVDSSFLAYAALQVLGKKMVTVTIVSPVEPTSSPITCLRIRIFILIQLTVAIIVKQTCFIRSGIMPKNIS